ncbi:alpha/beta fold hydrolase [Actinomycetospora endophytica]|uniref:Alpha/beta fold hydrolase n=1 Tax=Actinomycetospora endophytica TaxID=2291215 RepID=A0ABS8PAJ4_9PSEU|nr:alpha/beta fold hydrolase [Actinomycetospora endophytica]MCD2195287.1 alpha/beta fold hydrolase [Actinomycetospora endophytica]
MRTVVVEGRRLRIRTRGEGRPLLIITGIGAGLELAEPFEDELLRRGTATISFDAPGVGGSDPYPRPRRMSGIARTVQQLVARLGHDDVDVLGVSMGGLVAQQLAHQAPHLVRRLVLAATAPGVGGIPGSPWVLARLATPRRYQDPDHLARIAGQIYGGRFRGDPGAAARHTEAHLGSTSWQGYLGQLYAVSGWTSLPWIWRLSQPTLVLAGSDDPIVPVVNARILGTLLPRSRVHVADGLGHLFLLEEPAAMAELVRGFLDTADQPRTGGR